MSRSKGIGRRWIEKYKSDVYPQGMMVVNGKEVRPPAYYDRWHKNKNPAAHRQMQHERHLESTKNIGDNYDKRLEDKETVKRAALQQLKRKI